MGFIFQEVDEDGFLKDMLNYLEEGLIIKIGRASCRERV